MNNYFESNVKDSFSFDTAQIIKSDFKKYDSSKFLTVQVYEVINNNRKTISQIVNSDVDIIFDESKSVRNSQCRSIVSFNMFLLHVLSGFINIKIFKAI